MYLGWKDKCLHDKCLYSWTCPANISNVTRKGKLGKFWKLLRHTTVKWVPQIKATKGLQTIHKLERKSLKEWYIIEFLHLLNCCVQFIHYSSKDGTNRCKTLNTNTVPEDTN